MSPQRLSMAGNAQSRRSNRLIHEHSPYPLQHAYNPVEWYPWGPEALAKAKAEEKPIFLSIGYSTCYWCHVMEQESFEDPAIAELINADFVPIKVDREERPDLDAIYMSAVTALSGQGGWPMTVFLTPGGQPFWGGTYFPPEERGGRPGLPTILRSIAQAWRTQRQQILSSSQGLTQLLQARESSGPRTSLTLEVLEQATQQYEQQYDTVNAGFGPAPKFPRSHSLSFLLRAWYRRRDPHILAMVESTLEAMARGGLYDHVGGGFHRYSTDERWLVPHFEKMLYDQALLARTYLEAFQITGNPSYAETARGIFTYVLRDLRDPSGAFYSAEDAGEVGEEGAFYVWTPVEVEAVLGEAEARLFNAVYDVTPQGNFEGHSILHLKRPLETIAKEQGIALSVMKERLAADRAKLLEARSHRPRPHDRHRAALPRQRGRCRLGRPHRDDKILTDWNGLMIGALAYGARVLDEPRYAEAAAQAATVVLGQLQRNDQLLHRLREGHADIAGFLDDYACFSWGLLELYEATFEVRWLTESRRLAREMARLFWDNDAGGFFFSGPHNEALIAKPKELYDGAVPSGNSVAALLLVRLGTLTMDQDLQRRAEQLVRTFANQVARAPHAVPQFLIALDAWLGPSQEIVIAGNPQTPQTRQMIRAVASRFLPRAVRALHPGGEQGRAAEALIPWLAAREPIHGQPAVYLCQDRICQLPSTDVNAVTASLDTVR